MKTITYYSLVVLGTWLLGCASNRQSQMNPDDINLPTLKDKKVEVAKLEIYPNCDPERARKSICTISWLDESKSLSNQRVDITAYKEGFEAKVFAALIPLKKEQRFDRLKDHEKSQNFDQLMESVSLSNLNFNKDGVSDLKGMSVSAEKLRKQKAQLGRKLVVSENGQVKLVSPDSQKS